MRRGIFRIRFLLLASVFASAWTCGDRIRPQVGLHVPADLLERPDEPPHTEAALTSEDVREREVDAKIEWGRALAAQMDAACRSLLASGVTGLRCRGVGPN